ncbi:MAG: hypothetical protein HRU19_03850 [Pseudobacteriovorax sp.]|nr:hypothetical protein [Pseudobacteriovorax sp.]
MQILRASLIAIVFFCFSCRTQNRIEISAENRDLSTIVNTKPISGTKLDEDIDKQKEQIEQLEEQIAESEKNGEDTKDTKEELEKAKEELEEKESDKKEILAGTESSGTWQFYFLDTNGDKQCLDTLSGVVGAPFVFNPCSIDGSLLSQQFKTITYPEGVVLKNQSNQMCLQGKRGLDESAAWGLSQEICSQDPVDDGQLFSFKNVMEPDYSFQLQHLASDSCLSGNDATLEACNTATTMHSNP